MGGGQTISMSETRAEALTLQSSAYGVTKTVVHGTTRISGNLSDYLDFKAIAHVSTQTSGKGGSVTVENTTYTYSATIVMMLCEGRSDNQPIEVRAVWRGKTVYREKDGVLPLAQVGATLLGGLIGQAVWSPLNTLAGGTHSASFSGMACIAAQDYDLGGSNQIENHMFEVAAGGRFPLGSGVSTDADPALIVQDWMTNELWGLGLETSMMGNMAAYSAYCRAAGLLMSPALEEQAAASDRIKALCDLTNAWSVMMDNAIHIVPLGDEELSGNEATYTPDVEPVAHLSADVCKLLRPRRKAPADAYNIVRVEYRSRDNDYNIAVADAKDLASIEQYGARPASTIQAHWILDKATADRVAQIALKRFRYILNTYECFVPWNYAFLVPSSIVTLTDPDEGLDGTLARVRVIEEDANGYKIETEEFPHAVAGITINALPSLGGYKHDYNVEPGPIAAPQFFEAPVELTTTGLEVYVAVAGTGNNWGGCQVWVSNDGTGYRQVSTIYGGCRYGTLTAPLAAAPAGTLAVQLSGKGGQIISGSQLDAERLATLCWVKGTGGGDRAEYLAYETATLLGSNQYSLAGLVRGAYGTDQGSKASVSRFVRVDEAIGRSGALQPDMIGQTLRFKFASFNVFGGAPQGLDECDEYTYTITGEMMRLAPPTVTSITPAAKVFGIDLSLVIPQQAANLVATEIWWNTTNDRATATKLVDLAYPASTHSITGLESGAQRYFWARLVDVYDNVGAWYPASATAGVSGLSSSDAAKIMSYLTGQISETQLATDLAAKVVLITAPDSASGSVNARIKAETDARVSAIADEVANLNTAITAGVNTAKAYTESWAYQKTATDSAIASAGSSIRTDFAAADATTLTTAQAYTVSYSYSKSAVDGSLSALSSSLTSSYAEADTATLNSAKSYADATVASYAYSKATVDSAIASSAATISARLNTGGDVNSAIVSVTATASAASTNVTALQAQYTVKVDVNGKVAGYGLASTSTGATPTSEFSVLVDRFSIAHTGGSDVYPFIVQGGAVYMNKAFIGDAWIEDAMIGNLIKSTVYTEGVSGWKIDKSSGIKVFTDSGNRVLNLAATGSAPVLKIGSLLELKANGDSSYGGALSGATGTFSGLMTASAVNAVKTINIDGNAVTIPTQANWSGSTYDEGRRAITGSENYEGKPVILIAQVVLSQLSNGMAVGGIRLWRDTTPIYVSATSYGQNGNGESSYPITLTCIFIDTPPSGAHSYAVGMVNSYSTAVISANIAALGAKR